MKTEYPCPGRGLVDLLTVVFLVFALDGTHAAQVPPVTDASGNLARPSDRALIDPTGKSLNVDDLKLSMLWIPSATFTMGSPPSEAGRSAHEGPQARVTLTAFWLGKTEVTQAQWQTVMGNNPSDFRGEALPVENILWAEAVEFCRRLTERERAAKRLPEGFSYKLPTEAQWEYACRAGSEGAFAGESIDALAWYSANSAGRTHPVAQKRANAWGFHDMHGNVCEWCSDWYGSELPAGNDPAGAVSGEVRVRRGGGWGNPPVGCRSADRYWSAPGKRLNNLGFRLALSPGP